MKKSLLLFSAVAVCSLAAYAQTETTEPMVLEDEGTVTWTLTPTTAIPAVGGDYSTYVVGNQNNFVRLTCPAANIKTVGSGYELHCGSADNHTAVYTFGSCLPGYTVTGFSLTLTTNSASTNTITINGQETALNSENQTVVGTGNTFTIKGTSAADNTTNFPIATNISVTLTRPNPDFTWAIPTESGWYKIYNVICQGNPNVGGQQVYTLDSELLHSNLYYPMALTSTLTKVAAGYMYVNVANGTYQFQSPNGHYIKDDCTQSLTTQSVSVTSNSTNNMIHIGSSWNSFAQEGYSMVGKNSSGAENNLWAFVKVSDEELAGYDIWTVNINVTDRNTSLGNYVKLVYDSENNKGVSAVYNNGKLFVTKGTTISAEDLTFDFARDWQVNEPEITINNTDHTINVNFSPEVLPNHYVRINASTPRFFYDMNVGGNPKFSTTPETAIYFYNADGRLVHFGEGRAATRTGSSNSNKHELAGSTTAAQNANLNDNAMQISFVACNRNNVNMFGRHYVVWDYDASKYALLYCNDTGEIGKGAIARSSIQTDRVLNNLPWTFKVEYVNELPVKIGADGKGSLIAPVAVTVPAGSDDFTFYTAKTNSDGTVGFEEVTQGDIPANTPIVIKRSEGCEAQVCNVTVNYNPVDAPATRAAETESNDRFFGSYLATVAPTPAEGEALYVKCATEGCDNDNDVVFSKVEAGSTIPAGTIAFKAVNDSEGETPTTLTLDLGAANSGTTSINSIYAESERVAAEGAIYDLQGRRLAAPVRGINIINGKKILVK